jgi:chemotaxis response regulator CheB
MKKIRVLIAEDHTIVRQGLSALLRSEPDIEVVGEASDGLEATEMAKKLTPGGTKGTLMKSMTLEISIPSFGSISPRPRRRRRRVSQSQPSPPPNHD